jgi:predicted nucleic acid-binding protein
MSPVFPANGGPLVADASAVINLNATGCAPAIIKALPTRIVVVDVIPGELDTGRNRGRLDADRLQGLVAAGLVSLVPLGDQGWDYFEGMVSGPAAETLDDGEAATIAYAAEQGAVAVIDETKATRISGVKFPGVQLISSVDMLLHAEIRHALGEAAFVDAVFAALRDARMAVFPRHYDDILRIVGPERAVECLSLPKRIRTPASKPFLGVGRYSEGQLFGSDSQNA